MSRDIPLIRLDGLQSIVSELDKFGVDLEPAFNSVGLTRQAIKDPDAVVHAMVLYQFFENAAAADPRVGGNLGKMLPRAAWPPLATAARGGQTIGDFITRFITGFHKHSTSSVYRLEISRDWSLIDHTRVLRPPFVLAQNDAAMVSAWIEIFRRSLDYRWDPNYVTIWVAEPTVLPEEYARMLMLKCDQQSIRIRFPAAWLFAPFSVESFTGFTQHDQEREALPCDFLEGLRLALQPHLGQISLSMARVATLYCLSQRTLERELRRHGTTLFTEIEGLKSKKAKKSLSMAECSITDLAASLGYSEPSNFTRSFKRWTGLSPKQFRCSAATTCGEWCGGNASDE